MKLALIICTYMRPNSLLQLLQSVQEQTTYPEQIIVVDGSLNTDTEIMLQQNDVKNLDYNLVRPEHRGLTKQRNFGIEQVDPATELIAFVDDDTVLSTTYFEELIKTFEDDQEVVGVGGVATNENGWSPIETHKKYDKKRYFQLEGYVYKEGQRNLMRNFLGLQSDLEPGKMPAFSHGKTCGFPLNGKIYEVDLLIGMSFAFRKRVFDSLRFSPYFEGYGLYEDADFSIRVLQFGKNVINTKVQLKHFHHHSGRPNQYQYGKMVVRNGWYVWRTKNPNPTLKHQFKWHAITIVLTLIRFTNVLKTAKRKEAFTEAVGRTVGWFSLWFDKPFKL